MHLLRVADLTFETIPSHGPFPRYAILSHTWLTTGDEITFRDIKQRDQVLVVEGDDTGGISSKKGWDKILFTIAKAKRQSLSYVWIDTCCINKADPVELAEAINCMFNWYRNAAVCYAYIAEEDPINTCRTPLVVAKLDNSEYRTHRRYISGSRSLGEESESDQESDMLDTEIEAALRDCRWISRGWTLQELIAPPAVLFYNKSWSLITSRSKSATLLSRITGIDKDALLMPGVQQYSIAQRMCWAADRRTTRPEDRAYSLLGLFGVMMPLFYGEGEESAFQRLQEEIIKASSDQSIFAWVCPHHATGLLACDPECFKTRSHVVPRHASSAFSLRRQQRFSTSYFLSNRGLQISLPVLSTKISYIYQAILNCRSVDDPARVFLLNLYRIEDSEYCVIDGHAPRCIDMDWHRLPATARERANGLDKQEIVIRRSWAEYSRDDTTRWEMIVRLNDTTCPDQTSLFIHSTFPAETWLNSNRYYKGPLRRVSDAFDGMAAICLAYLDTVHQGITRYVTLNVTHQEALGSTLLTLTFKHAVLEEGTFDTFETNNDVTTQGNSSLHTEIALYDGTSLEVVLDEVDMLGDAVWELQMTRRAVNAKPAPASPVGYTTIFDDYAVPLELLEYIPCEDSWLQWLPTGSTVVSAIGYTSSFWSQLGKVEVRLEAGIVKDYLIKFTKGSLGQLMSQGEYESMKILHTFAPDMVPEPFGFGTLASKDTHFFLCEFVAMHERCPVERDFCTQLASLHLRSQAQSPGQFGFPVTTCSGKFRQYTTWSPSWEYFFTESLRYAFAREEDTHGPSQDIANLMPAILDKVCPRLLRPLETEGRVLKPTLVHGDLWVRNIGIRIRSGSPVIFDAAALWAHNEYEVHCWRGDDFDLGKSYIEEYQKHFPPSEPAADWGDRNRLYSVMSDLICSAVYKGTDKFRTFVIDKMKVLVRKFPNGYEGPARCKANADPC